MTSLRKRTLPLMLLLYQHSFQSHGTANAELINTTVATLEAKIDQDTTTTTSETASSVSRSSLRRGLGWVLGIGGESNSTTSSSSDSSNEDQEDNNTYTAAITVIESVPCEPDHAKAVQFVSLFGDIKAGNEACVKDAESCNSGCCRFSDYFLCDSTNAFPDLPCVCNRNTKANHPHQGHDHPTDLADILPNNITNDKSAAANDDMDVGQARDGETVEESADNADTDADDKDNGNDNMNEASFLIPSVGFDNQQPDKEEQEGTKMEKSDKDGESYGKYTSLVNYFTGDNSTDSNEDTSDEETVNNNGNSKNEERSPKDVNEATFLTGWGDPPAEHHDRKLDITVAQDDEDKLIQDILGPPAKSEKSSKAEKNNGDDDKTLIQSILGSVGNDNNKNDDVEKDEKPKSNSESHDDKGTQEDGVEMEEVLIKSILDTSGGSGGDESVDATDASREVVNEVIFLTPRLGGP